MKKVTNLTHHSPIPFFLLSFLFMFPLFAKAQITVTEAQFQTIFTPGQSHYYYHADSTVTSVNIGKKGGPNIYDFTGVGFQPMSVSHNYQVSSIPVLAARYPANAITFGNAPDSIENNPVFLFGNDTLFGVGKVSLIPQYRFIHNQPYKITAVVPVTYGGNSYHYTSTHFDTTYSLTGGIDSAITYTATDTVTVDGYGTLKIPGHQLQCLRLKMNHGFFGDKKEFVYLTTGGVVVGVKVSSTQPDSGAVQPMDVMVLLASTVVGVNETPFVPRGFSLSQNYPNPFNPTTVISYQLSALSYVTLKVYDVLGREVATLVNEQKDAGEYKVIFDASTYPSGVYFYRITTGNYSSVKKMLMIK